MSDYRLGKKIVPEARAKGPVIERLGPKLWSVDGKYQDSDPTPPPPTPPGIYQHMLDVLKKQQEDLATVPAPDSAADVMAGGLVLHDTEFPILQWGTW